VNANGHRRQKRALSRLALLLLALSALVLSASLLTTAAVLEPPPRDPNETPAGVPGADASFLPAHHANDRPPYSAQGLTQARWEVGAVQAGWTHRPLWQSPVTGEGVRVAVIDTGVDADHPDLRGRVVAWKDFVNNEKTPYDDTGHGTHVAGIIAAGGHTQMRPDQGYFLTGARGVAPGAEIIAAKAMDENGRGDPSRIAEAILWSLDPDGTGETSAHIINLSLGIALPPESDQNNLQRARGELFPPSSAMQEVQDAIRLATQQGAIVVVAAGNHDAGEPGRILFPGTMDEVITVGALDPQGHVAPFSNRGQPGDGKPDLVAPGVVLSTSPLHDGTQAVARYRGLGGTSMAAPFVSGTIALMIEADGTLGTQSPHGENRDNTERVRTILQETARPLTTAGPEAQGAGVLRVDDALAMTGTGDAGLRPSMYAAPFALVVGGTWVAYRRRSSATRQAKTTPRTRVPPSSTPPGTSGDPFGHHAHQNAPRTPGYVGPHHPYRPTQSFGSFPGTMDRTPGALAQSDPGAPWTPPPAQPDPRTHWSRQRSPWLAPGATPGARRPLKRPTEKTPGLHPAPDQSSPRQRSPGAPKRHKNADPCWRPLKTERVPRPQTAPHPRDSGWRPLKTERVPRPQTAPHPRDSGWRPLKTERVGSPSFRNQRGTKRGWDRLRWDN
jgi:serine protease AprX